MEVSLAEAQDQHRAVKEAAAEEYASLEASKAAWEREAGQLKETMSAVTRSMDGATQIKIDEAVKKMEEAAKQAVDALATSQRLSVELRREERMRRQA